MPSCGSSGSTPSASSSLVGLMRLTIFEPGVLGSVIFTELDVSTMMGTLCWAASGIMASVIELPQAPMMTGTLSRTISFCAALSVSAGSDLLSSMISSSRRPFTPPLALMRSRAILPPLVMYEPAAAMGPDSGWMNPTFSGSCCASVVQAPLRTKHAVISTSAVVTNLPIFMGDLLGGKKLGGPLRVPFTGLWVKGSGADYLTRHGGPQRVCPAAHDAGRRHSTMPTVTTRSPAATVDRVV